MLYQAKIHPEQYSNTLTDTHITNLHDALIDVCTIACETLADSSKFPDTWLMKHRWNKGKKDSNVLPNGEKIIHLKVGGRTSAVVPSVQKKTGPVAGDVDENAVESSEEEKPKKKATKKAVKATNGTKHEDGDEVKPVSKKRKSTAETAVKQEEATPRKTKKVKAEPTPDTGRKRSGRVTKQP